MSEHNNMDLPISPQKKKTEEEKFDREFKSLTKIAGIITLTCFIFVIIISNLPSNPFVS